MNGSSHKYKASACWFDTKFGVMVEPQVVRKAKADKDFNFLDRCIYFASKLELATYLQLRKYFPADLIRVQQPITLVPNGFSASGVKSWRVDFVITNERGRITALVEAKGVITEAFPYVLALLEQNSPALFQKLYLVFRRVPKGNKTLIALQKAGLGDRILILSELEKLEQWAA